MVDRRTHWESVYSTKDENQVSWFQENPSISIEMIKASGASKDAAIIDIGGGASRLVDALLKDGFISLSVLDLSAAALEVARKRIGPAGAGVEWIVADVTTWQPARSYDLWHDRATFHFLTEPSDRAAYLDRLHLALRVGGQAIIGTFALDGPEECSGLPVQRYDSGRLAQTLGSSFELVEARTETHRTPRNSLQSFQFSRFRRRA